MGNVYKTSRAQITPSTQYLPFIMIKYVNPEIVFTRLLREYFVKTDFKGIYPAFGDVRVGVIHPFALMLMQDVLGQTINTNVFPSITISDSSDVDSEEVIGRGFEEYILTEPGVVKLKGHRDAGELICSDTNFARLEAAVQGGNKVYAKKYDIRARHNVDFNIWSDNKDVTSLLYDYVKLFTVAYSTALRLAEVDIVGTISGRRSGDINVEFSKLLYGSSVVMPCTVEEGVMEVDLGPEIIDEVILQQQGGEYHAGD